MKTFASLAVALIVISWWPASLSNAKIPPAVTAPRPQLPQPPKYAVIERCRGIKATAYYAPLKNQKRYSRKPDGQMRTYREEIRFQGEGKVTASGYPPRIGTIAVNRERFPYGTILRIKEKSEDGQYETIFIGVAEDTGEDMIENPNQLDLFMGKGDLGLKRAERFGARHGIVVEVLKEVKS
jgi:3D (Asp-Asp-Asp) domain-containing protein